MTVTARELKAQIAEMERKVDIAEQAGLELEAEYRPKIDSLLVEIINQKIHARQVKIGPVLDGAIRAGKLYPSQRATFEAHLMATPFEKFDAELEKLRVDFEEAPQVIELGAEYGDGFEQFDAPGSGRDPRTREELEDELRSTVGPQAKVISSSGIREEKAAAEAQESEGGEVNGTGNSE